MTKVIISIYFPLEFFKLVSWLLCFLIHSSFCPWSINNPWIYSGEIFPYLYYVAQFSFIPWVKFVGYRLSIKNHPDNFKNSLTIFQLWRHSNYRFPSYLGKNYPYYLQFFFGKKQNMFMGHYRSVQHNFLALRRESILIHRICPILNLTLVIYDLISNDYGNLITPQLKTLEKTKIT